MRRNRWHRAGGGWGLLGGENPVKKKGMGNNSLQFTPMHHNALLDTTIGSTHCEPEPFVQKPVVKERVMKTCRVCQCGITPRGYRNQNYCDALCHANQSLLHGKRLGMDSVAQEFWRLKSFDEVNHWGLSTKRPAPSMPFTKTCVTCGVVFKTNVYPKATCSKPCQAVKERLRKKRKRARMMETKRAYVNQLKRDSYYRNKESILAYQREYNKRNAHKINARSAQWQRDNPDKVAVRNARYRAQYPEKVILQRRESKRNRLQTQNLFQALAITSTPIQTNT